MSLRAHGILLRCFRLYLAGIFWSNSQVACRTDLPIPMKPICLFLPDQDPSCQPDSSLKAASLFLMEEGLIQMGPTTRMGFSQAPYWTYFTRNGVLLYGPPGTGKTLPARAVAHHTDCTFIRVSGSELVQKYIGEGSRMVRELFVMAREHTPSIIFMDEIDSIGSTRMESGTGNGDSEVQRTMLELLNQLDGFEASNRIKVLMATNRIDILDQALLRPDRIDRKIEFPNPNEDSRFDILKIHSRKMNLMRVIDLKKIAEKMNGASGAELKAVCTEAGMFALQERRVHVTQEDFEMAVAKVTKKDRKKRLYGSSESEAHGFIYQAFTALLKQWKHVTTSLGQMLDLIVTHSGPDYLAKYSIEGYRRIVKNKTSYYPFYLPAACALLVWCKAGKLHWAKGYSY